MKIGNNNLTKKLDIIIVHIKLNLTKSSPLVHQKSEVNSVFWENNFLNSIKEDDDMSNMFHRRNKNKILLMSI